jgi:DNA/RNA endonuclease YhcR with UshA esterase domain
MRYLERRPVRTKLQRKVVTAVNIAPDSISPDEVNFPTITVESGDPTEVNLNPVQGDINIDPIDGSSSYYDITTEQYEPLVAVDPFAQETATQAAEDASTALLTADGKNAIYSQTTAPTGGTYAADDLWFDTDDGNKLYRYVLGTTYTVSNKALTNNFATLTTSGAHGFAIGQSVTVSGVDATFNGTYTVTSTTSTTFTYAKTASNVVSVSSSGSVTSAAGWISAQDTAIAAAALAAQLADEAAQLGAEAALVAQNTADGKNKIYRQTTVPTGGTYAEGDTWFDTDGDNAIYRYSAAAATSTVSNKALTLNVATLTTSTAHSFTPGESITVTGVDATFNGTYTVIAVPTTTTLTYAKTATNVTSIASSGTITNTVGWKAITLGNNAITSISATKISTGTLAAGVLYAGNINANQISTGTIASNIVYAGTVNANQINAGTLAAGVVYAGTVNADKINAGSLNVDVVYAGKINTTQLNAGTIAAGFTITSPTISGGTITAANFTSPNFASGTGIGITTSSTIDSIKFRSGGVERASFDVVSGGLLITSGSAQLVMTAAGAMSLSSASNTLLMAAAPYFLSGSGSNIGGAYGSIRNTWVDTADPSGGDAGDVWLKWS